MGSGSHLPTRRSLSPVSERIEEIQNEKAAEVEPTREAAPVAAAKTETPPESPPAAPKPSERGLFGSLWNYLTTDMDGNK